MKRLIIAAMIPLAFLLTSCGEKKINPNDYLTIAYDGYSEAATAVASLDANKMVTDYPEAFRLGKDYKQSDLNKVVNTINQSALGTLSKTEGISNGDEISFSWDKNALSALEGSYKVKWAGYKDVKETAAGIPELEKLNPFDYYSLTFKEKPQNKRSIHVDQTALEHQYESLCTNVRKNSGDYFYLHFEVLNYQPDDYNVGDKIKVRFGVMDRVLNKFTDEDVVELCKQNGYLITQTEKEYTVE